MDILRDLKNLYLGEFALYNHMSNFSLLGIMTVAINSYIAYLLGNFYGDFLGFAPANSFELFISLFLGLMILIFSVGYYFKFVNTMYKQENLTIIEPSLSCFYVFIKMLPLLLVWAIYMAILFIIGMVVFPFNELGFHLYFSVLICLLPFVNLILIAFARNYKYRSDFFNPFILLWVLDKTIGKVIFLSWKTIFLSVIPFFITYMCFVIAGISKVFYIQFGTRLFGTCMGVYFIANLSYIYANGLVRIVRENLAKIQQ